MGVVGAVQGMSVLFIHFDAMNEQTHSGWLSQNGENVASGYYPEHPYERAARPCGKSHTEFFSCSTDDNTLVSLHHTERQEPPVTEWYSSQGIKTRFL